MLIFEKFSYPSSPFETHAVLIYSSNQCAITLACIPNPTVSKIEDFALCYIIYVCNTGAKYKLCMIKAKLQITIHW